MTITIVLDGPHLSWSLGHLLKIVKKLEMWRTFSLWKGARGAVSTVDMYYFVYLQSVPALTLIYSRNRNQATTPCRNCHQANTPCHHLHKKTIPGHYDASCSTTTLHRHLANDHWEAWIMSCNKAHIEITSTSKEVRRALDKFEWKHGRGDNVITSDGSFPVYRTYTPKAFLDAIVKWIIADDQVCLFCLFIIYYLQYMLFL